MMDIWYVSIHAPARGATTLLGGTNMTIEVSIHAPARGATSFDPYHPHR